LMVDTFHIIEKQDIPIEYKRLCQNLPRHAA
jgi:hypothetical protein